MKIPMMRNDMPTINMRFRFGNPRRPVHHEKIKPPQLKFWEATIESICFNLGFRDDMSPILTGLQYIYASLKAREDMFSFQERWFPRGADLGVGRAGMDVWRVPVLRILKRISQFILLVAQRCFGNAARPGCGRSEHLSCIHNQSAACSDNLKEGKR